MIDYICARLEKIEENSQSQSRKDQSIDADSSVSVASTKQEVEELKKTAIRQIFRSTNVWIPYSSDP